MTEKVTSKLAASIGPKKWPVVMIEIEVSPDVVEDIEALLKKEAFEVKYEILQRVMDNIGDFVKKGRRKVRIPRK